MRAWENFLKVKGWTSEYKSVSNFLSHYKRKVASAGTRDQICDVLMGLCRFSGKNPDDLVKLGSTQASSLLQSFIDGRKEKGQSIRTVNVSLAYLRMFFRLNGFKGAKELEVERYNQPSRYRKRPEYIPTPDEIHRMAYSAGSVRNKAMVLALYTSGLRNSTLRAVLYGEVKDDLLKQRIAKISVTPEMKRIDPGACKGNIPYYSFISKDAINALLEYLDQRSELGGNIKDDEPLFAASSTNVPAEVRKHTTVKKRSLDEIVKRSARLGGIASWKDVYPHCLRKAFESALRNAGLDVKDQEFLMGHILPGIQDAYYDKTKVEDLRQKYARVNFFPERSGLTEDSRKRQIIDMAKVFGYSEEKIKKIEDVLARYRNVDDGIQELRRLRDSDGEPDKKPKTMHDGNGKYLVAKSEDEMLQRLHDGWTVVQALNHDKYLLEKV